MSTTTNQIASVKTRFLEKLVPQGIWLLLIQLLAGGQPASAQVAFAPAVNYTVGVHPQSITVADVNADGKLDVITANNTVNNTLTVLTNNGNGRFALATNYTGGISADFVMAMDVNGDGSVDLISANENNSGTLSVFTNNGSGHFTLASSPAAGNYPIWLAATNLRGGSLVDLVVANSSSLLILTNNGSGGFGSNATISLSPEPPTCVIAADLNADGKTDLIYSQPGIGGVPGSKNALIILTNNGSGIFTSNATLTPGSFPQSIIAADLTGHGKLDLVCANHADNTLSVFTNRGNGQFVLASTPGVGPSPNSIATADLNGDGRLDLVCANGGNATLTILLNNGNGTFGNYATLKVTGSAQSVVAADVNADGHPDLICANTGGNTLSVLIAVPTLTIHFSGTDLIVSWPSSWADWTLQQNLDLTTSNWFDSSGVIDDGTTKSLTVTSLAGNAFFRLVHP